MNAFQNFIEQSSRAPMQLKQITLYQIVIDEAKARELKISVLTKGKPLASIQVARLLEISPENARSILRRMERRGLLVRDESQKPARWVTL